MERIGFFGGTFNPVHTAHLKLAELFLSQNKLDKCIFVPAYISPFKNDNPPETTTEQRLEMLRLSIKHVDKFLIDDYELTRGETSYSIDTLNYFRKKFPDASLFMLIGDDQALLFKSWKNWEEIISGVDVIIARRKTNLNIEESDFIKNIFSRFQKSPIWLDNPVYIISSTDIRNKVKKGENITGLVNVEVEKFIKINNLY